MRVLLVIGAALLLAVPGAAKGGPQPLGSWSGGGQFSQWVEQQQITATTPTNNTACLWSVNDHEAFTSSGYLDAGVSVSRDRCVISDYPSNSPYGFSTGSLWSKSETVILSVCFQPQGRCFAATPIWVKSERSYHSTVCVRAHYTSDDPLMAEIAGSEGGRGLLTTVTTTVTNSGSQRVRDLSAQVGYASDIAVFLHWQDAVGCLPAMPYVDHFEYPFEWTAS